MCEASLRPNQDFPWREKEQAAWYEPHSNAFKCCLSKITLTLCMVEATQGQKH